MINKLYYTKILIISISFTSCVYDKLDLKLKLINGSDTKFYNRVKKDTNLIIDDVSFISEKIWGFTSNVNDTVSPTFAFKNQGGYIRKINKEGLDSSLYLYLFEIDSVKKYGWNKIVEKRIYFRSQYNVKQLDSMHWFIHLDGVINSRRKPF
jgi:hypothetical protein